MFILQDGIGEFFYNSDTKVYWVSFLNGMQRVLLFTHDLALATIAQEVCKLDWIFLRFILFVLSLFWMNSSVVVYTWPWTGNSCVNGTQIRLDFFCRCGFFSFFFSEWIVQLLFIHWQIVNNSLIVWPTCMNSKVFGNPRLSLVNDCVRGTDILYYHVAMVC